MKAGRTGWPKPPGPVAPGLRIGLLGGSFNPAHEGHIHLSELALARLGLDYVWWLVSPQNPLKAPRDTPPLAARLAQARKFASHPRIVVTDIERMLGTHYTIDTIAALQRRFPQLRFVWLMGSDNLASFDRWKNWPSIARRVPIAVILRPGSTLAPLHSKAMQRFSRARCGNVRGLTRARPPAIAILGGVLNAQSSTAIRASAPRPVASADFRRATRSDVPAVRDLVRAAYAKWVPTMGREPKPMTADYAQAIEAHIVDLLTVDGRLVGVIEMVTEPNCILIENIAVAPGETGKGYGRLLMAHAADIARARDCGRLRLYTNKLMAENIAFYLKLGYRIDEEKTTPDGRCVVNMSTSCPT